MATDGRPIEGEAELVRYFEGGSKARADFRIGVEQEKIGVYADGRAVPYEGERGIGVLLERLRERGGYTAVEEEGRVIALVRGRSSITLEPGGQLELSGAIVTDAHEAKAQLHEHLEEVRAVSEPLGISWLAIGFRPFGTLEDVPWMPKGRYRIMRAYLPQRGRLAHEMMKRTATIQTNLDYEDEADAARKVRTAMGLSSILTALCANSPIVDGRASPYLTYRAAAWLETDPDRCGLLPFVFEGDDLFARYTAWALDVPMFFVYRGGYMAADGMTFRRFLREGFRGERATMADWELHLSTLFPEVRLKQWFEVRGCDSGPAELVPAIAALCRGLLYDRDACAAAWALVSDLTIDEREALRRAVPRQALSARVRDKRVLDLARELVAMARAGLSRLGRDEAPLLRPLEQIATEGRTLAEHALGLHARTGGDPRALIPALKLI